MPRRGWPPTGAMFDSVIDGRVGAGAPKVGIMRCIGGAGGWAAAASARRAAPVTRSNRLKDFFLSG